MKTTTQHRTMNPAILHALMRDYNNPASTTYRSPRVARVIAEQIKTMQEG